MGLGSHQNLMQIQTRNIIHMIIEAERITERPWKSTRRTLETEKNVFRSSLHYGWHERGIMTVVNNPCGHDRTRNGVWNYVLEGFYLYFPSSLLLWRCYMWAFAFVMCKRGNRTPFINSTTANLIASCSVRCEALHYSYLDHGSILFSCLKKDQCVVRTLQAKCEQTHIRGFYFRFKDSCWVISSYLTANHNENTTSRGGGRECAFPKPSD